MPASGNYFFCPGCGTKIRAGADRRAPAIPCQCGFRFPPRTVLTDANSGKPSAGLSDELPPLELDPWEQAAFIDDNLPLAPLPPPQPEPASPPKPKRKSRRKQGFPSWAKYMLIGAALSPVLTLTPFLQYLAWILSSIIHEAGHTIFAWFVGCPALPAINLAGHAMTTYSEQRLFLCFIVWGLLALGVVEAWRQKQFFWLALVTLLLYPVLAFLPTVREVGFLLSGHGGELVVAGIFLWQARTCLFVHDQLDRTAYAVVGWYLIFANAWLCFGLVFVPRVLSWYRTSGSYQLTNDYLRVAEEILHVPLAAVVLPVLLVAMAVPPMVLMVARQTRGAE